MMVDIDKLTALRANHREAIEMARQGDNLGNAWLIIGAMAAVLDNLLTELIGDGSGPLDGLLPTDHE
jgi:hypothetical protein